MGGGAFSPSRSPSRACISISAILPARLMRAAGDLGWSANLPNSRRRESLKESKSRRSWRSALRARVSSGGRATGRSTRSGSSQILTREPTRALAADCIFLLTSRKWPPRRESGKSEVRKAWPAISPRTRRPLRTGQVFAMSKGTWAMTHLSAVPSGSRSAVKDVRGERERGGMSGVGRRLSLGGEFAASAKRAQGAEDEANKDEGD